MRQSPSTAIDSASIQCINKSIENKSYRNHEAIQQLQSIGPVHLDFDNQYQRWIALRPSRKPRRSSRDGIRAIVQTDESFPSVWQHQYGGSDDIFVYEVVSELEARGKEYGQMGTIKYGRLSWRGRRILRCQRSPRFIGHPLLQRTLLSHWREIYVHGPGRHLWRKCYI